MESGKWIRALREERSIKPRDIERITKSIADTKVNPDFYVSHSTLADIESGSVPSIHKLYSLSLALKVTLTELLSVFGIEVGPPLASLTESQPEGPPLRFLSQPAFRFQLNFDKQVETEQTALLNVQARNLASLLPARRERLDPTRYRYALIGSKDDSLADLLPPRSLVEIDTTQKTIETFPWRTLRERPIYLVWHPHGHTCCWCQVEGKELSLIPHPVSQQRVRRFKMPNEASVIGRVTSAWLPLEALSA
jgi:transcriptional regulator with XRE-family HTH domain